MKKRLMAITLTCGTVVTSHDCSLINEHDAVELNLEAYNKAILAAVSKTKKEVK